MIFSTLSLNGKLPQCNHVVNPVPSSRLPTKPVHVEWWCHTLGTTAKCVDLSEDRLPIAWTTDLAVKSPIHSTRAPSMMTNTKLTDQWSLQYTHRTVGIEHLFHQSQILTARANPALLHHRTRAVERELECFEEIDFLTCIKKLTLSGELRWLKPCSELCDRFRHRTPLSANSTNKTTAQTIEGCTLTLKEVTKDTVLYLFHSLLTLGLPTQMW